MKIQRRILVWSLWGGAGILSLLLLLPLIIAQEAPVAAGLGFDLKTLTYLLLVPLLFFLIGYRINQELNQDWMHSIIMLLVFIAAMVLITGGQSLQTIAVLALFNLFCDFLGSAAGRQAFHKKQKDYKNTGEQAHPHIHLPTHSGSVKPR